MAAFFAVALRVVVFFGAAFLAVVFLAAVFLATLPAALVFLAVAFLAVVFLAVVFLAAVLLLLLAIVNISQSYSEYRPSTRSILPQSEKRLLPASTDFPVTMLVHAAHLSILSCIIRRFFLPIHPFLKKHATCLSLAPLKNRQTHSV